MGLPSLLGGGGGRSSRRPADPADNTTTLSKPRGSIGEGGDKDHESKEADRGNNSGTGRGSGRNSGERF